MLTESCDPPRPGDAQALWLEAPGHAVLRSESLKAPGSDEVLLRSRFGAISRGTESLVFKGEVPENQYEAMRAPFQAGCFPAPVKYGYAVVGTVEAGPEALRGRWAFCLHPHQTRLVVPAAAVHLLPPELEPARAVLAANMETALNGCWDAAPRLGDRIAVIGAGVVGLLTAYLLSGMPGCTVEVLDTNPAKAAAAHALGLALKPPADGEPDGFDLVIHASGAPEGLATALALAAFEARIVELSWFGSRAVTLPLGEGFHSKRLCLISSQVGSVAPAQRSRWTRERRMALALALLADPVLDALITGESAFTDLPATLARLSSSPGAELCHRIVYP